jgi:hypothetical protein
MQLVHTYSCSAQQEGQGRMAHGPQPSHRTCRKDLVSFQACLNQCTFTHEVVSPEGSVISNTPFPVTCRRPSAPVVARNTNKSNPRTVIADHPA